MRWLDEIVEIVDVDLVEQVEGIEEYLIHKYNSIPGSSMTSSWCYHARLPTRFLIRTRHLPLGTTWIMFIGLLKRLNSVTIGWGCFARLTLGSIASHVALSPFFMLCCREYTWRWRANFEGDEAELMMLFGLRWALRLLGTFVLILISLVMRVGFQRGPVREFRLKVVH